MRVKFSAAAEMRSASGAVEYSAAPGDVLDLREDQAQRWIKRGKAALVADEPAVAPEVDLEIDVGAEAKRTRAPRTPR